MMPPHDKSASDIVTTTTTTTATSPSSFSPLDDSEPFNHIKTTRAIHLGGDNSLNTTMMASINKSYSTTIAANNNNNNNKNRPLTPTPTADNNKVTKQYPQNRMVTPSPPPMPSPPPFAAMMMMTPTGSSAPPSAYHPDFMFCASCITCQPIAPTTTTADHTDRNNDSTTYNNNDNGVVLETLDDYLLKQEFAALSDDSDDPETSKHETRLKITTLSQAVALSSSSSSSASHTLLIQSLLQQLAGVESVVVDFANSHFKGGKAEVSVRHTLQTSQGQLVAALKRGGYESSIMEGSLSASALSVHNRAVSSSTTTTTAAADENPPIIVRSQFHVGGICCAMEIFAIRKIVRPLPGVETLQINITTKMVYVQHDAQIIAAQVIAKALTGEGFPAEVLTDGAAQYLVQKRQKEQLALLSASSDHIRSAYNDSGNPDENAATNNTIGRTTLLVKGRVLSDKDAISLRQQLLSSNNANSSGSINNVEINFSENIIVVEQDLGQMDSHRIPSLLTTADYELQVIQTAQEELQNQSFFHSTSQLPKSKYVESTIVIANLQHRNIPTIQTIFRQNYTKAQVRAFFANVPSQTIKVEHDPELLPVHDIPKLLDPYGLNAHVAVDGKEAGLVLPLMEDYSSHQHSPGACCNSDGMVVEGDADTSASLKSHVIFSGLFWVLSMLSAAGGVLTYFEYFGLLSVFFGLPPVARKAWRTIRRRQFDSNCMMVTAALGALVLQEFDEAASVAFLFSVSEFLEARSTSKAQKALKAIVQLRPEHASVIHPKTKEIVIVPASQVPVGSLLSVRTGDKIAADGVVVEGASTVDESSLTGESKPIMKRIEDVVSGGTINVGSTQLIVKTTASVEDSVVSRLIKVVEDAQSSRSLTEKMIDKFAKSYTPFVVCMAAFMCTVPWIFGAEIGRYWTLNGLIIIVIACPCSLTISTPVTYAAGLAATAQRGIIVKGGAHLEALGGVETVVMDKTGTLTHGQFHVENLQEIGQSRSRKEMLELLALMEAPSSHPLSATLVRAARKEGVTIPKDADVSLHTTLKGEGVTAKVNGKQVYVGNKRLFHRIGFYNNLPMEYQHVTSEWADNGATVGFIGIEGEGIIGAFSMMDTVREEAAHTIQMLRKANIKVIMLTGDGKGAAEAVARQIGIPLSSVHSHLLPEDKMHYVGSLIRPEPSRCGPCKAKSKVLFVGDGINDTPALAVADVGVSMGDGAAALAMEISDVTLMDSNLEKLLYVINMGSRVVNTIQENIAISLLSKLLVVLLTFAGKMTLFGAIASDVGVMLLVTLNGMKLLPVSNESDLEPKARRRIRSPKFSSPEYDEIMKVDIDAPNGFRDEHENDVEMSGVCLSSDSAPSNGQKTGSETEVVPEIV